MMKKASSFRCTWSAEIERDLLGVHGINMSSAGFINDLLPRLPMPSRRVKRKKHLEAAMVDHIAYDISRKIDDEIVQTLLGSDSLNAGPSEAPTEEEVASFKSITLPMVRRIYPGLIASQIQGVQPISGSSKHTFWHDALRTRLPTRRRHKSLKDKYQTNPGLIYYMRYRKRGEGDVDDKDRLELDPAREVSDQETEQEEDQGEASAPSYWDDLVPEVQVRAQGAPS